MLKTLRLKLTLLYSVIAVGLVGMMGGGTYALINLYFQRSVDLALQYKMSLEFRALGLSLPVELAQSEQLWQEINLRPTVIAPNIQPESEGQENESETEDGESRTSQNNNATEAGHAEEQYDGDLAPVFVVSLDEQGSPIPSPGGLILPSPLLDNGIAVSTAMKNGFDLRTISLADGQKARVLTYRTGVASPSALQAGRLLTDQTRLLNQYLTGLLVLGAAVIVILGLSSWWLAGRSLGPAQKAWDQQQTFVSNASHELRTPLTFLRANADYGLRRNPPDEHAALLSDIVNEADYMNRLIEDLLLLSRLDAKRLQLQREAVDISELFSEIARQMERLTAAKGVTLETNPLHGKISGDRTRLRQVLLILLDNALRFTPAGGTIRLEARSRGKHIEFNVTDTGMGIAPEHLPHLFERFYQAQPSATDDSRSNGLGLSIAKALIEAHGGRIQIQSEVGKGTRVTIVI